MNRNNPLRLLKNSLPFCGAALALFSLNTASALNYPSTILADHPVAYYRMEETSGGTIADSASGLYPATINASGAYPILGQPGILSNSVSLSSAQGANITVPYADALNQPGPFSFEIWARPVSVPTGGAYRCPIGNSPAYGTATQSGWYVYQTPDSPSEFALVTPTGDVFIQTTNYSVFNWYYLAGTYDGTNMSFYVNSVLVGTQRASSYVANSVNNTGACQFGIGQRGDGYGTFDGGLDEAAFYTNALTLAQIQTHYQVGTNSFTIVATPPSILTSPASTTAYAGHSVQFTVQADGTAPLKYQWYNGTAKITGATNSTYSFVCATNNNNNQYDCVVSNSVGSATSASATLTVSTAIVVDGTTTSIVRNVGSSAAFEIVVEGAYPLSYQWVNGNTGSNVLGATSNVLWLYNVQLTNDSTSYYVVVSNPYTNLISDSATLNVQARPVTVPITKYAAVVVADKPTALWRLDETTGSSTATDAVGSFDGAYNVNSGTFAFDIAPGIPHETNYALGVSGGAVVTIPYAIEINPTGAFSVDGWFKPASVNSGGNDYRTAISSISNPYGQGPTGWLVYQTAFNNWAWWPYNGNYAGIQITDYDQVVANQWYHLGLVYDGTTFTFYVNGVAKGSSTDSAFVQNGNVPAGSTAYNYNYNSAPGYPPGSAAFVLGYRSDSGFNPFAGGIDDVAVYNSALSPQQIQNHFNNSTFVSSTLNGNKLVLSWPIGTLQSSTNAAGPYTNVVSATSPFTNTIAGGRRFYRVKTQ